MWRSLHIFPQPDSLAWLALFVLAAYYGILSAVFRWGPKRRAIVTQYAPPDKISPAVAACLIENGRFERAFAVALVSLARKGYVQIQQRHDWYVLEKIRDAGADLAPEEAKVLSTIFSDSQTYAFNVTDCDQLCYAYRQFETIMKGITDPDLISPHAFSWGVGLACSVGIWVGMLLALPIIDGGIAAWSIAYCGLWAALGASCLVSAIRMWPDTIRKISSLLFFRRGRSRPINLNDVAPVFLTVIAATGFAFLAISTSVQFAIITATLVIVLAVARRSLEAPTAYGRKVTAQLNGFREFLSRADADRLMRENLPGATPKVLETYSPYAVALDIDRGWGREFAYGVAELIEYEQGSEPWSDYAVKSYGSTELSLRPKPAARDDKSSR